jgi:hypothetical protein
MNYKLIKTFDGKINSVLRSDGWTIPFDPGNRDYQEYREWLAQGNEPEPADEVTE